MLVTREETNRTNPPTLVRDITMVGTLKREATSRSF